jgi:ubiquinone/menaquinone biosynthesis C-methylase UbiE
MFQNQRQLLHEIHESLALDYDINAHKYKFRDTIDQFRAALIKNAYGKILETGVGTSNNLLFYSPDVEVTAVDWSEKMLLVAASKNTIFNIRYVQEDVEKMSFGDNSFDCVVDTFGMEYYLNPKKVLEEMKRVCKKDGRILIMTSGAMDGKFWKVFSDFKKQEALESMGYFALREWDEIIKDSDFEIEEKLKFLNGSIYMYSLKNSKKEK